MRNILLNISGKIDNSHIEVLRLINDIASDLKIPFFVIGATARDWLLEYCYGRRAFRATLDLDLAIKVENWDKFNKLRDNLLKTEKFIESGQQQRLQFDNIVIDIVPFGQKGIENNQIKWPPEYEKVMSLLGFEEVYDSAVTIRLNETPILDAKVPTLPGLAILKLFSWKDAYPDRKKDAEDLRFIIDNYEAAGNFDRIYDDESDILRTEGYDAESTSIKLLGMDIKSLCSSDMSEAINTIFLKDKENLVIHMMKNPDDFGVTYKIISKLEEGFNL